MSASLSQRSDVQISDQHTVFVGGPFSSALQFGAAGDIIGFDAALRAQFDRVHGWLKRRKFGILSSHLAEGFGADVHESTLVQRDNTWLRACDVYLAVLPIHTPSGEPFRTDGTFVEIGMAIALGRPCVLLIEQPESPKWSYYVRNLGAETDVWLCPFGDGETGWDHALDMAIKRAGGTPALPIHVTNPAILTSLTSGGSLGHTVKALDRWISVPSKVLSSRYDGSLRELCALLRTGHIRGQAVLILSADAGELGVAAVDGGAKDVAVRPVSAEAALAQRATFEAHRLDQTISGSMQAGAAQPDIIIAHFPPVSQQSDAFRAMTDQLVLELDEACSASRPGTTVLLAFANEPARQAAFARLARLAAPEGTDTTGQEGSRIVTAHTV